MSETQSSYNLEEAVLAKMVAIFNDKHRLLKQYKQNVIVKQQAKVAALFAQLKSEYGKKTG